MLTILLKLYEHIIGHAETVNAVVNTAINCSDQYLPIFDINNSYENTWTLPWNNFLTEFSTVTSQEINNVNYQNVVDFWNLNESKIKPLNDSLNINEITLDVTFDNNIQKYYNTNNVNNLKEHDIDYSIISILDELNDEK